jgi:hypothetical protein
VEVTATATPPAVTWEPVAVIPLDAPTAPAVASRSEHARRRYRTEATNQATAAHVTQFDDTPAMLEHAHRDLADAECQLRAAAPDGPDDDPGWPGGWVHVTDQGRPIPGRVYRTRTDAEDAAVPVTVVWTPLLSGGHTVILDQDYWATQRGTLSTPDPGPRIWP